MADGKQDKEKCQTIDGVEYCGEELERKLHPVIPSSNANQLGKVTKLQCHTNQKTKKWTCKAETEGDTPPSI